ncbi:MAG: four helix bundle protein [Terriglobia bacterium]
MLKSFRELEVWQKAHALALDVYRVTEGFPDRERFGVVAQLRRAATSIPANIAEGFGRRTTRELLQCLTISNGSLEETRYFLILGSDLNYMTQEECRHLDQQCDSVAQMLSALARSLRNRTDSSHGPRATSRGSRPRGR